MTDDDFLPAQDVLRVDEKPWQRLGLPWVPCDRCSVVVEPWPQWPMRLCARCQIAVQHDPAWQPGGWDAAGQQLSGGVEYERIRAEKLAEVAAYKRLLAQRHQTP